LHHPRIDLPLVIIERVPRWYLSRTRRQRRVGRNDAEPFLVGQSLLALLVPALIELALELRDPVLAGMMRGMTVARSKVHQERIVGRDRMLGPYPVDGPVGHVVDEYVVRVTKRRQNGLCILKQGWMPIVG